MTILSTLDRMQDGDGCFPCTVTGPDTARVDRNGFATALVVRALRDVPGAGPIRSRALDFVERCRSGATPGAFGFWPDGERPPWAPRLPADVDDTAVMTLELVRYGRLSRQDAVRTVCRVLLPQRGAAGGIRPPWVLPGAFRTWITSTDRPNPVDACVNTNVAALMAILELQHLPGYAEAVRTVAAAVAWAGADPVRHKAITPFYPHPRELLDAVGHAVACGARELEPVMARLPGRADQRPGPEPICCAAYGHTYWWCPALDLRAELSGLPASGPTSGARQPNTVRSAACSTSTRT